MNQAARPEAGIAIGGVASRLEWFRQAGWWAGKASWAVLDQGLFATSNFILGILLARWLSPEQFGSFAVAQSVFLLAGTLHTGLFTEPMLVFGSARHANRFPAYLDILLHAHWRVTAFGSLLLLCAALAFRVYGSATLAGAFLGVAIATPFILFCWLVRRACLSRLQPQWAATGGALYLLLLLTGCYTLWRLDRLAPFSAFLLLGGAGLVSGLWILDRLHSTAVPSDGETLSRSEVIQHHWSYGRWAVASSALSWIPGNVYYILLPTFVGLEAAGALRAVSNLVLPIFHFNSSFSSLLLPALAAAARRKSRFNRLLAGSLALFAGGAVVYGVFLTLFRVEILAWLYRGEYRGTAALVPIMALLPISAAVSAVLGAALRALERPQQVFWAYTASAVTTVTAGIWGMAAWGLAGAAIGALLSSVLTAVVCGACLAADVKKRVEWV